jgi:hypothetical protein
MVAVPTTMYPEGRFPTTQLTAFHGKKLLWSEFRAAGKYL